MTKAVAMGELPLPKNEDQLVLVARQERPKYEGDVARMKTRSDVHS